METAISNNEEVANLFKILSRINNLRLLFLTQEGISSSKYAMDELDISSKIYYTRLNELVGLDLVTKIDGIYRQTPIGKIICRKLLPMIKRTYDVKDKLGILELLEGNAYEDKLKKVFAEELKDLELFGYNGVKVLQDYESLAVEAIDLYDSAKESTLLASNYWDVRVMEALFRAEERGIINRLIVGKRSLSSELKKLRMMLSLTFAKSIINFTSKKVNLKEFMKFVDLPYTFCVMDGQHSIIEVSNPISERFIFALLIDDEGVAEKLTEFYDMIWEAGEHNMALKVITSIGARLKGEAPHQDSEL